MKNYKCKEIYKIKLRQPKSFIYLMNSLVRRVEESNSFLEMSRDLVFTVDCDQSEQSRGEEEERDVSRRTVSLRLRHSQSRTSLGCGLVMCIWVTSLWSGALLHVVRSHTSLTSHHPYLIPYSPLAQRDRRLL